MIVSIKNNNDFIKVIEDVFLSEKTKVAFEHKDISFAFDKESIINNSPIDALLIWDHLVWANLNEEGLYDSVLWFIRNRDISLNEQFLEEYFCFCKNEEEKISLLNEAMNFAKDNGFKYVKCKLLDNDPSKDLLEKLYNKLGFKRSHIFYISEL